ncbi:MAG TPA: helix-turn-helix domain-containing protein [Chloroflexia bacterium]|nr:helix-turn-helix domain-containing protein [Chloroflexia bacterium]
MPTWPSLRSPAMPQALTLADLLATGAPLDGAAVVAGRMRLDNPVIWAVSLRPYAPAIPPVKGGEIALASAELLSPHDPPITLSDVVRQLSALGAAAAAYRGDVSREAIGAAEDSGLPLLQLPPDASLPEIEQAIMRECALFQARREIMAPLGGPSWVESLLSGRVATAAELQSLAAEQGVSPASSYAVAWIVPRKGAVGLADFARQGSDAVAVAERKRRSGLVAHAYGDGLAVLVPPGTTGVLADVLFGLPFAAGVGAERPALEAPVSLAEARLAAAAAARRPSGGFVHYARLGADRLLLLLLRDNRDELERFVRETLGPLQEHDSRAATPLLPTVESFVSHGGRLRETAADIFVHRNTLAYRLDRAAELLGADLKDPSTRLSVELALRALPLLED